MTGSLGATPETVQAAPMTQITDISENLRRETEALWARGCKTTAQIAHIVGLDEQQVTQIIHDWATPEGAPGVYDEKQATQIVPPSGRVLTVNDEEFDLVVEALRLLISHTAQQQKKDSALALGLRLTGGNGG